MTTASDGPGRAEWWKRTLRGVDHHLGKAFSAYLVTVVVTSLTSGVLGFVLACANSALVVLLAMAMTSHRDVAYCQRCIDRFPANAPEEAARRMRWILLVHRHWVRWVLGAGLVWLIVSGFWLGPTYGIDAPRWVGTVVSLLPLTLYTAVIVRSSRLHQRLQLWCPICRRGRWDDDSDPVPTPTPIPSGVMNP